MSTAIKILIALVVVLGVIYVAVVLRQSSSSLNVAGLVPICKPTDCLPVPCQAVSCIPTACTPVKCLPVPCGNGTHILVEEPPPQPPAPSPRKILINYGQNCCWRSQPYNCATGLRTGGFDECRAMNQSFVDPAFQARYQHIFAEKRGAGYWIWKPYIIYKTLLESNEGDFIFYADSGSFFVKKVDPVIEWAKTHEIVVFPNDLNYECLERNFTKRDCYIIMNADKPEYQKTSQINGAFFAARNTWNSKLFVSQWLTYATDPRVLTDMPNVLGKPNLQEFKDHRHDQSILSLLSKMWGISEYHATPATFMSHNRDRLK